MRRFHWLLGVYLVAIVVSRLSIIASGTSDDVPIDLPNGMHAAAILPFDGSGEVHGKVRLAYRTQGSKSAEAVVFLHGSPGSLQDFASLGDLLGPDRYVIVPDMLGFGRSERSVPDFSFVAQAAALLQLFDQLGVERVHLVGFSWGGGVAIELLARAPERIVSLVMVSAIGVQELELLGRFELNRLVHAFQHALVIGLDWALPHFGLLSQGPGGAGFSRSFLDSDQRPMRARLERFTGPMLIVHGRDDFLVPASAAREHHRLVPQSEIVWVDGGHLVLWSHPGEVARALKDWLTRADTGTLPLRRDATPDRLAEAAREFDRRLAGPQDGLGWIVFFLLVFVASMVSEDLTCAGVGLMVATGQVGFAGAVAACVFALVVGDLVLYGGGRIIGPPLLRWLGRESEEVGPIGERLHAKGGLVILLGRFVPGARLPTYVAAGALGYPVLRLVFWLVLAAAIWAPVLVGVTAVGGRALEMQNASAGRSILLGTAFILAIALAARILPRLVTHRGRRLTLARWRRLRRWEFWPIGAIYGPLIPSFVAMALRHGSVRLPTLVNPPIPGGGLAGESKAAIGRALAGIPGHAIETELLESGSVEARFACVLDLMARFDLDYPIVLKPDVGDRGRGVLIAEDQAAVREYLEKNEGRVLAQAYVPGEEFGIFYVRMPGEPRGEIFSLARKVPRFVTGDGVHSLEGLILDDEICLPMAEKLLRLNRDRLADIPARGERVRVTQLGTHSLGCRFLVGEDLRSDVLEAAIDRLSQAAGLDFGRYDVRAPSEAALGRGEFKIVEFNGLTGEAAHLYDPRYGLLAGLRILREQWRRAFEIGAAHRTAGRRPLSWRKIARLVRDARAA
ncbi:MAG: alpha/beta fold hydrolase [bacterium]|nr:hypothetical protein [Deltaproteobacteria bacterium]MCP4907928.1 alpha/beta fold hydrolase [bacterium]